MTSYSAYGRSLIYHHDSLLFAPATKDYVWPVDPIRSCTSELLDDSKVDSSCGSGVLGYQRPAKVVSDTMSEENLPPLFPDAKKAWLGTETTGKFIGQDGLASDKEQPPPPSSSPSSSPGTTQVEHPHLGPLQQTQNLPTTIRDFHSNRHQAQAYTTTPPSPLVMSPTLLDHCYQRSSPPPSPRGIFTIPLDVGANLGCYDMTRMMMSLEGDDDQNYDCGFNTGSDNMSPPHEFANWFFAEEDDDADADADLDVDDVYYGNC